MSDEYDEYLIPDGQEDQDAAMRVGGNDPDHRNAVLRYYREGLARNEAREMLREDDERSVSAAWRSVSGAAYDPDEPEPPGVVMRLQGCPAPLLPPGVIATSFGSRGSLKTWLWLYVAFQEMRYGRLVLVFDYEMGARALARRMHAIRRMCGLPSDALDMDLFHVVSDPPATLGAAGLAELVDGLPTAPTFTVFDTVGEAMGRAGVDGNNDGQVAKWLGDLVVPLRKQWPETVVYFLHHLPKGITSADDPIGSHRIGSHSDVLLNVVPDRPATRTSRGQALLRVTKDRPDVTGLPVFEKSVVFEFGAEREPVLRRLERRIDADGTLTVDRPSQPWATEHEEALLRALHESTDQRGTVESLRRKVGVQSTTFTAMTDDMKARGLLNKEPRKGIWLPS